MTKLPFKPSRARAPKAAAPPAPYAELQVTTNFSFLRGGSHAHELAERARALGHAAIAVTDRNTLAGIVRAHVAAKTAGLRFIVGCRLDLLDGTSLLAYPRDRAAYGRLCRLLTLGQRRAPKGQCHLWLEDVAAHGEGLVFVVLAPDNPLGDVPQPVILSPSKDDAGSAALLRQAQHDDLTKYDAPGFPARLAQIVRALPSRPYLAVHMLYRGDDRRRLAQCAHLAARNRLTLLATNDVQYHGPERRPLQDVLTCIREKCTLEEAGYRLAANAERHLKSPTEMARLFKGYEEALEAQGEIVRACAFSLDELAYEYPDEPVPPGKDPQTYLESLAWSGAGWRFPDGLPDKVRGLISHELKLIAQLGYAPYFLTVYDIVQFAMSRGILCQGRGSAANSVVCYCLGITAVNPAEVDLLFERFVSAERREPPDIDVDFEHERREEVIQYIYERYGREKSGLAATVICYRPRSAVREVGKAMGLSEDVVAALSGTVWGSYGNEVEKKRIHEAGLDMADPLLARAIALTHELIGFPRHLSQHVGGFVLTRGPLTEVVPIGNAAMDDRTVVEWDKDDLDALGILKIDVLALGMLSCLKKCFELLDAHYGRRLNLASVPRDDAGVYDMLCKGDSLGVFQVESRAQMTMLPRLKPRCYYDLVIEVAIVRPGPIQGDMVHPYLRRRDGIEQVVYPKPAPEHGPPDELERVLKKTMGVPLFQEQAMRIAIEAAKFTPDEANTLRRAMATFRKRGEIDKLRDKMVGRMVARGYDPELSARCFRQIEGFGEYGFPESHAASFAHLVYVSAWFKHHYPDIFCAALLNAQPMGFYAPAQIVRDAREHGVEVRPVDVNRSDWDCTLEALDSKETCRPGTCSREPSEMQGQWIPATSAGMTHKDRPPPHPKTAVRLGLRQVDGLAQAQGDLVVAARDRPFADAHDLWQRSGASLGAIEKLAAADAFRSMGEDRRAGLWSVRGLKGEKPLPLFAAAEVREAGPEPVAHLPEMALAEHVVVDYQTLRLSLKAHPMAFLREHFAARGALRSVDLAETPSERWVKIAGVVLVRQRPGTAKGVVFMTLEDETGVSNVIVWPDTLERFRSIVMGAYLVEVDGRLQRQGIVMHVISARLTDRTALLRTLSDDDPKLKSALARADEIIRPSEDYRAAKGRHPRDVRVIPRSRDFH